MVKNLFEIFNIIALVAIICTPFFKTKGRVFLVLAAISIETIITFIISFLIFNNGAVEFIYSGSFISGTIPIRIDHLSAWFIIIISFTFLTGIWYGITYLEKYKDQSDKLALHFISFILTYTSLINICVIQNSLIILVFWEIMALGSFILVIFDHQKTETLRAGINFLIQSHVCILFLTLAFMWIRIKTGSFDFKAITDFTSNQPSIITIGLFLIFFFGFAIKAGFVPFHTWLPLAHPAAPAHISGIMSGVIIKIGIYGIMRVLMLIKTDMIFIGYFIIIISVISGIYGVMLAIIQHNLKKLLAYHSIENIGIIGIGIGLGCLGMGYQTPILVVTGFGGALLHTLNHSLFKSLLFFSAGNVFHTKHTMNIESMGGLIKWIPNSAILFLIGSIAICGLPPLNGFVSEFFIFSGLFEGINSSNFIFIIIMLFSILGLVIIGGLAMICFTKAFGMVFLGSPRSTTENDTKIEKPTNLIPLYIIAAAIVLIGLFPVILNPLFSKIINLYQPNLNQLANLQITDLFNKLTLIGRFSLGFIGFCLLVYLIRQLLTKRVKINMDTTWSCGYTGETTKTQYTASSFIRTFRKLAEPLFLIKKEKTNATGLYPSEVKQTTQAYDKLEVWLIEKPIFIIRRFLNRFMFLQNGNIQAYILYGFIFVGLAVLLPLFIDKFSVLINFLNQL